MARLHVEVTGRVQGVGFRWFVRERARALGLAGWVMNRDDGAVEVAAEGNEVGIRALRDSVQEGPSGAYVELIRDLPDAAADLPTPFAIKRP